MQRLIFCFLRFPCLFNGVRIRFFILSLVFLSLGGNAQTGTNEVFTGCASDQLMAQSPALLDLQQKLDMQVYQYLQSANVHRTTSTVAMIPTVVHIVHNGGPENISNAQVITAINNINSKYLSNNNYQVQLCLAQRDPANNPTTGITRDSSIFTTDTMEINDLSLKNIIRWDPNCYLNIWVIKEITSLSMGSGVIGYATFPSSHGQNNDGLVIEANYFGTSSVNDCVGAHELGHYLGLYHTFQNACTNNNCLLDGDQVCDTPPDQTTFAICNPAANSCNTDPNDPSPNNPFTTDVPDLSDDYMDYSNLTCYTQFTPGQYDRMQYFLTNVRNSLLGCLSCTSPCPSPVTATITSPNSNININVGTGVNFSGTASNSTTYQWYLTSGSTLSTTASLSYTFTTVGTFWIKFSALSGNTSLCLDGIDSVQVNVLQPPVASCGGALEFLHTNDAVLLPTPSNGQYYHNNNGFTWECWLKLTTPFSSYTGSLLRSIITAVDPVVYQDICLSFGWSGGLGNVPITSLCFKVDGQNGPSNVSCSYVPSGGYQLGTWYHVAGTMDYVNHTSKLYLNGALVDTKTNNSTPFTRAIPTQLSWDVSVNPGYTNPPLGGNMDEVRIWSTVRTPTDIATNYNKCLTGNEPNLMLYYRCDQSAGTQATDASPNGYNGTLTHQAAWSTQQAPISGSNCFPGCGGHCPAIKTNHDTIICPGATVQLNASNGFLSYTWTPSTGLNNTGIANPLASPAATTTYVVTGSSTDTSGQSCTSLDTVVIKVVSHASHTLNLGPDVTLCANGTQTFNAGQGFAHYQWSDGDVTQTTTVYGPGKYWVTVTDSCGGTQSDTVSVTLAATPTLQLGADTTICLGGSTTLKASPPGTFSSFVWTPGTALTCTTCATTIASPTVATQYILTASTSQGCTSSDTILVKVSTHVAPTLNLGGDIVFCNSSTHTFDAGLGFMNYQWSTGSATQTITVNGPGNYWVTVVDSCGGVQHDTVAVYQDSVPLIQISADTTICPGKNVTLSMTPASFFAYEVWSPNTALSCDTCAVTTASPTVTTQYVLTANTTHGCTARDTVVVNIVPHVVPFLNLGGDVLFCNSGTHIFDAGPGFTNYQWSNGSSSQTITVNSAGNYWVTVKDSCGGTQSDTVLVNQDTVPPIQVSADTTICPGKSVTIAMTPAGAFASFGWSPSSSLICDTCSSTSASPAVTTQYILTATTTHGCITGDTVTVNVVPHTVPTLDLGPDILFCNSGTHMFNAGSGFISYQWSTGSVAQAITVTGPGNYWVTVNDSCGGIQRDTAVVILDIAPPLQLRTDTTLCLGTSVTLSTSPASAYATFNWSPNAGLSCDTCATTVAGPTVTTQYFITASTALGCTARDSITLTVDQNIPTAINANVAGTTCSQPNGSLSVINVVGGSPVYQFSLNGASFTTSQTFTALAAGAYTLQTKDNMGCELGSVFVIPDQPGPTAVDVTTEAASSCAASGSAKVLTVTGGTAPYLFSVNSGGFASTTLYPGLNAGTYTLVVKDTNNCVYNTSFVIDVIPEAEDILIPNVFTPNGDLVNETWFIKGSCIRFIQCIIYDRWGVEMARINSLSEYWDGKHKGTEVPDGVYFHVTEIIFDSGKPMHAKGAIQLMR